MIKPYITLKIEKDGNDFVLTEAKLHVPRKGHWALNVEKVCSIINRYDGSIYEKRTNNEYRITDEKVMKELTAKRVKRQNRYVGKTVAIVSLVSVITASSAALAYSSVPKVIPAQEKNIVNSVNLALKAEPISQSTPQIIPEFNYNEFKEIAYTDPINNQPSVDTIFSYDSPGKSNNEEFEDVLNNPEYQNAIAKYAPMYGLDPLLISAKISQENPYNLRNDTNIGARGVSQIESVWWGHELTAYNFETKSYETITVDGDKLYDPDYAIKLGCMILSQTYHEMYNAFVSTGVLSDSECIIAALTGYNMGGPTIKKLIKEYGSDYINHRDEIKWGDKLYYEHVLSFLNDGTKITFLNLDETESYVYVDNLQSQSFTK